MAAAYDTYDYTSYWEGRDYEHASEVIAIRSLLARIPKISTIIDVGAGFGRLTPAYAFRGKKIILSDPSAKLLAIARQRLKTKKNIRYVQGKVETLPGRIKSQSADLAVMIRVLHHIEDIDEAFDCIDKFVRPGGYFILEFANKGHLKATLQEFLKGNFTFPIDIFPKDVRSGKSKKKKTLPFLNYHPEDIEYKLRSHGFKVIERRSVSNIRSGFLKKILPQSTLIYLEKRLQKPLSWINFGPSIFILSTKNG